jgi:actin related protein 2/3 complex subunit 4
MTLRPYLDAVRSSLTAAICLENFSSQMVERHNKPEVEVKYVIKLMCRGEFCVLLPRKEEERKKSCHQR